ncbi:hypothetical protein OQA88_2345 [Cercophora sp. LCS_1]
MTLPTSDSDPLPFRAYTSIPGSVSDEMARDGKPGPKAIVFSLRHRPRATRASVPKVRSGCITCKFAASVSYVFRESLLCHLQPWNRRRHVKCDEAKPACQRCLKWQGRCEGYSTPDATSSRGSRSKSPPSPQTEADTASARSIECQIPTSSAEVENDTEPDSSDSKVENSYLNDCLTLCDNLGGGWFPTTLFGQTIPHLGRTEPAVRYAAIAVGALANAVAPGTLPKPANPTGTSTHYNRALTYYGRALRLVRLQQDINSDYTLRVAVIACVLFACFEALHDNSDSAISHITHGLMIVEQFLCSAEPGGSPTPIKRESSPTPFALDEEILAAFQRLEYLAWSGRLVQRLPDSSRIFLCNQGDLDRPGNAFTGTVEALKHLDTVQHQATRCVAERHRRMFAQEPYDPYETEVLERTEERTFEMLEKWRLRFEPLYIAVTATKDSNSQRFFQATALLLSYLSTWVCLRASAPGGTSYEILRSMTPRFEELVRLSHTILENQPKPAGSTEVFTMDHGPTSALFLVVLKCVDAKVRTEAMGLLKQYPRRDAFWDSRAVARVAEMCAES